MKNVFLIIILSLTTTLYSQSKIDFKDYRTEMDTLNKFRSILLMEKQILQKTVDSLKNISNFIDEQINVVNQEIENLYIKKFGKVAGKRIYAKQVWKGMTEKMLLASWGKPDKIERNVEKWGTFTQWYYGKAIFFFRDGKLIDFEEIK